MVMARRLSTHTGLMMLGRLLLVLIALLCLAFVFGAPGSDPIIPIF